MKTLLSLLVVLAVSCGFLTFAVSTETKSSPRVLAHYMPWFRMERADDGSLRWEHWQWFGKGPKHDPDDILENGRRDIASVFYPLIGPYDGRDPAVLEYHMLTAKAAGIGGFVADWYGPGNHTDAVFAEMVKAAEKYGMKVAICLEEKAFFPMYSKATTRAEVQDVMEQHIRHVLNTHAKSASYLTVDNRPVFFMFNNHENGSLGRHVLTPEELDDVLNRFGEEGVLFARTHLDAAYNGVVDAGFAWVGDEEYLDWFYRTGQEMREDGTLAYWVGSANPGFNDSGVFGWGRGPRVTERNGMETYAKYWSYVLEARPDAVQIVTWNDFEEGTTIEPTEEYGFDYVNCTEHMAQHFTGRQADVRDNKWPYRVFQLRRRLASVSDADARHAYTEKLDAYARAFSEGERLFMGLRLWWLEFRIRRLDIT